MGAVAAGLYVGALISFLLYFADSPRTVAELQMCWLLLGIARICHLMETKTK